MQRFAITLLCLCACIQVSAQDDDDRNITIESAHESYRFLKGDDNHPVFIRQELSTTYLCNKYRATIPVIEFYDDQLLIQDVTIKMDGTKLKNLKPRFEYYNSDGIFYSDARVCYFPLSFEKKGVTSDVSFMKTVLDPRYFTNVFFTESYFVANKTVDIIVPNWMAVELKQFNFKGYNISSEKIADQENVTYRYTIKNSPPMAKESQSPGMTWIAPHILVMTKYADVAGKRVTYFNTLDDQYAWYHSLVEQIGNDPSTVKQKAVELTQSLKADSDKVKAIYVWVQNNIRYIAYEDGIAGFRPAKAQDVLAKKYGDCKGMANLTTEMIKSIGLDARLCWLGTNHIAYNYSTPSLSVDNHMISAWVNKDKIHYLDATEKYIGFNEVAERIQGRQVLIEDGARYMVKNIPVADPLQNTSIEKRHVSIDGSNLKGKVVQVWKGESKEWLLAQLHETKVDKQQESLVRYINDGNADYEISNIKISNLDDYNSDLVVEYDLLLKNAVTNIGNEYYIDVDNRKDFTRMIFDTAKRKLPYQFHYKTHMLFETDIDVPATMKALNVPETLKIGNEAYEMKGNYKIGKNRISYQREIVLKSTLLPNKDIGEWNENIRKLNEFYNNQLTLSN